MSGRMTRKRARVEAEQEQDKTASSATAGSSTANAEGGLRIDDELYYDDGTIIITARDVLFKVYKGPLIEHSPVFKDMLSLPQPPTPPPGLPCPVITLHDSPDELRHLLRVLMPSKHLRLSEAPTTSYHAICACVRLGHKYQIDTLVDESLKWLRQHYPDDFAVLHKNHVRAPDPSFAIPVVNLARLTGATYLLPMALAECCRLGARIVEGFQREDGSVERLSDEDLGRCFQAKDKLVAARAHVVAEALPQRCPIGHTSDDEYVLNRFLRSLMTGEVEGLCTPHVWESIMPLVKENCPDLCDHCRKRIKLSEIKCQSEIFAELPFLMGVVGNGG